MVVSNTAVLAALNALTGQLDVGGAGYIEIRSGSAPSTVEGAATGSLLGTLPLSSPAFSAATDTSPGGQATANAITADSDADNTGTAGWFRAYNGSGTAVVQGSISTQAAGSGDLQLDDTGIESGDTIRVNSWVITQAEG